MIPVLTLLTATAMATVDPRCAGLDKPADYDEQTQQDFLSNYYSLSTTFSAIHAPIPHAPGRGALGIDLNVLPPLGCEKQFVLGWTKTEDTNKTPLVPRFRASFAFPAIADKLILYAGVAYLPPVTLLGTRNFIASAELGAGMPFGAAQVGLRFHTTIMRTIGDTAGAFNEEDPPVNDVYLGSTLGGDASFGYKLSGEKFGEITPYVAAGVTDVSTFFWIGDDSVVTNNLHPYFGPAFSVGVDGLTWNRFRWGAEFYAAPGGFSRPSEDIDSLPGFGRYGHIYTARFRLAYEL
jgi:hypothetical protein